VFYLQVEGGLSPKKNIIAEYETLAVFEKCRFNTSDAAEALPCLYIDYTTFRKFLIVYNY